MLKESELDEFRNFLEEHKTILTQQYRDFDQERHNFDEMNKRMESDKLKISEEREHIEREVRRIRDLNLSLQRELGGAGHSAPITTTIDQHWPKKSKKGLAQNGPHFTFTSLY